MKHIVQDKTVIPENVIKVKNGRLTNCKMYLGLRCFASLCMTGRLKILSFRGLPKNLLNNIISFTLNRIIELRGKFIKKRLFCFQKFYHSYSLLTWPLLVLLSLFFTNCINDKSFGPIGASDEIPNLTHPGILIANEGGFTLGQASLSFYDYLEDTVYNNIFNAINGRPLGDVLQSLSYHQGKAYLVVNNSRKIEVVDSITLESLVTISNVESPREIIGYGNKIYVSDLFSKNISILDASTYNVVGTIETGGWTEKMLIYNDLLLVTLKQLFIENLPGTRKGLMIVDLQTSEEVNFINLPQGASSLVLDKNQKVWVLCDGGLEEEIGGLFKINSSNWELETSFYFDDIEYSASLLLINNAGEDLYFILSDPNAGLNAYDIFKLSIDESALPDTPFLDGGQLYIYGLAINEERNELYFTDAVGLIQEGFFYRFNLENLDFIGKYQTGIFPGQIYNR